jgi:hypothetical protein
LPAFIWLWQRWLVFKKNDLYNEIYGSSNTWTLNALPGGRGGGGHDIDKKNVNIGNLMYVKSQRKGSVVRKDENSCINIYISSVRINPEEVGTTVRGT